MKRGLPRSTPVWICEGCRRNLSQRWEKPGDLAYDGAIVILPRDDGTDSYWCIYCADTILDRAGKAL